MCIHWRKCWLTPAIDFFAIRHFLLHKLEIFWVHFRYEYSWQKQKRFHKKWKKYQLVCPWSSYLTYITIRFIIYATPLNLFRRVRKSGTSNKFDFQNLSIQNRLLVKIYQILKILSLQERHERVIIYVITTSMFAAPGFTEVEGKDAASCQSETFT